MHQPVVLSSSYFAPVSWFALAVRSEKIIIDIHEHYIKQTWRNRCRIAGANGPLDLIIPVKTSGNHTAMKDVRMDYATNWQRVHWHAIKSAYGKSPFFEFYEDRLAPLYEKQPEFLIDWNENCLNSVLSSLKFSIPIELSGEYAEPETDQPDFRTIIAPRHATHDKISKTRNYIQVFEERFGFQPNLSIIDMLFCCGPQTLDYLKSE
ncbi:MAG TPA: WbqC family protein [Bacteroidia bacterium]|nr:WbqC family protein [Bacteroidia bacterium]